MGNWLGTDTVASYSRQYKPFKKARAIVRRLGLQSNHDWRGYCNSGKKPPDIPSNPDKIYSEVGWAGWGDWLGTGVIATRFIEYRPFKNARAFVRRLGLKSQAEWTDYCVSGKKPADIPAHADRTYAKAGWSGIGDWLGTGTVAPRLRHYRPFNKARAFVRRFDLKSRDEWYDFCQSNKKPADIPNAPNAIYAEDGWSGWRDWLGNGRVAT